MKTSFDALDWTLAALAVCSLGGTFVMHWAVCKKQKARTLAQDFQPAISILKPLCGVDEGLYDNLVSFVEQRYPQFELVLGVADPRDAALALVQRLRKAYPDAPIRVLVHGEEDPVANPKVVSLMHMTRAARHEYLLVSDSNVRATPDYLAAIVSEMAEPGVGLVSSLIVGAGEWSLGAHCENLHLNTFVVGGVCLADLAGSPCVVGKSMLMRRHELARLGGFESLRNVLAEDYLLGQRYAAAGYKVALSSHAIATHNRRLSLRRFLSRHLRWAQLRRSCALGPFCSEPLLYASPWIIAPLFATNSEAELAACLLGLLARIGSDGLLAKRASGRWPSSMALACLPLKDAVLLALWTVALVRKSVEWRGHALRIGAGSQLLPRARPFARLAGMRGRPASAS
jgi:ceramide glucosyltransferase